MRLPEVSVQGGRRHESLRQLALGGEWPRAAHLTAVGGGAEGVRAGPLLLAPGDEVHKAFLLSQLTLLMPPGKHLITQVLGESDTAH